MIIRIFSGRVVPGKEGEFTKFLHDEAVPELRRQPGIEKVTVGAPTRKSPRTFMVQTLWRDVESIRRFAGAEWTRPHIMPREKDLLEDVAVHHFELADPGADGDGTETIELERVRLDLVSRRAWIDDEEVAIPPREFTVLEQLARRPGEPVSSVELAHRLWPGERVGAAEDVRRAVYRLRDAVGDRDRKAPLVRNRRGYGYVLADQPQEAARL